MRILNTKIGFIDAFFFVEYQLLKNDNYKTHDIKTTIDAFEYLNKHVQFIHGETPFKSYDEFSNELDVIIEDDILSAEGFANAYFNILPKFETNKKAFQYLNNHVELVHGKTFYKDFNDFIKDVEID